MLTVLCDVILPVGQTKKYVKTVIGIVVTLVVVQPLLNFVGQDIPSEQVSVIAGEATSEKMPKEIVNAITSKLKYRNTSVDVGKRNGKHE